MSWPVSCVTCLLTIGILLTHELTCVVCHLFVNNRYSIDSWADVCRGILGILSDWCQYYKCKAILSCRIICYKILVLPSSLSFIVVKSLSKILSFYNKTHICIWTNSYIELLLSYRFTRKLLSVPNFRLKPCCRSHFHLWNFLKAILLSLRPVVHTWIHCSEVLILS